jgi:hypothetical protein
MGVALTFLGSSYPLKREYKAFSRRHERLLSQLGADYGSDKHI